MEAVKDFKRDCPLVSVIIPSYNRADLLPRAVRSVLAQTYPNIEVIIVDDGSRDDTQKVAEAFRAEGVRYIRHPENKGLSAAKNTGIRNSQGEYIAFLDSDDEYLPTKIEKTIEVFQRAGKTLGIVSSNFWRVKGEERRIGASRETPFLRVEVFSRRVFEEVGFFDEEIEIYEDLEFNARYMTCFNAYFIKEPLVISYVTEGSMSVAFSNVDRLIEVKELVLSRHGGGLARSRQLIARRLLARIYYFLGKDFLEIGKDQAARKCFLKAFLVYPAKTDYFGKFVRTSLKLWIGKKEV